MRIRTLWLLFLVCLSLVGGAAESPTSKYTSTAEGKGSGSGGDAQDPSGFRFLFRGLGGYDVEHVGGDERSWINIRYAGKRIDLYETTMEAGVATGAFPHKANDAVEWRGFERNGRFTPYALIYRIVGLDENGRRQKTRLLVIRLEGTNSRIIGYADEPQAEAKARRIADRTR